MRLILDMDPGADDALALAEALANPALDLVAVTCAFGNVTQAESQANALALLELLGHPEVPVFGGAAGPLDEARPWHPADSVRAIHGAHGTGSARLPRARRAVEGESAARAINGFCRALGDDVAIVACGALTNLALALEDDPEALGRAGRICVMGGAVSCEGNVSAVAEANIAADPLAAHELLASRVPLTLVGLDVTMHTRLAREAVDGWRSLGTAGSTLADIVGFYIGSYESRIPGIGGCPLHDPLAVAACADPALLECVPMALDVALEGAERGRTCQRLESLVAGPWPHSVALAVDSPRFEAQLVDHVETLLGDLPSHSPSRLP